MKATIQMITRKDRNGYNIRKVRGYFMVESNFDRTTAGLVPTLQEAEELKAKMEEIEKIIINRK